VNGPSPLRAHEVGCLQGLYEGIEAVGFNRCVNNVGLLLARAVVLRRDRACGQKHEGGGNEGRAKYRSVHGVEWRKDGKTVCAF